jgi:integrase
MPRRPSLTITATEKGHKLDVPASLSASGKRERYYYGDERAANKHAAAIRKAYHERGTKAGTIPPALADEALQAQALLEPLGVSLMDAVRDYVKRNEAVGARQTVAEAWDAYEAALLRKGRSEATLADYKRDRKVLPDSFLSLRVGEATEERIGQALDACTGNRGKTWNRRLREVRAVLRAAVRTDLEPASIRRKDPEILTAEQSAAVMQAAVAEGCALPFALMLFAGIRPEGEISRISWSNIRKDHIAISGEESKTTDDRHIPISANLAAWIEGHEGEPILPTNWKRKVQAIRKAAKIEGQDVLRHSFASMFYRLHGEHETIAAMGHTSFKTTERFYKRAVTTEEAQAFFSIAPEGVKATTPKALRIA